MAIWRRLGDKQGLAEGLFMLGHLIWAEGDFDRPAALTDEGEILAWEIGNLPALGGILVNRALIARSRGDHGCVQGLLEEALALHQKIGFRWGAAWDLLRLADLARERGAITDALSCYARSTTLFMVSERASAAAAALRAAGIVAADAGKFEVTAHIFDAAETLDETLGIPMLVFDRAAYDRALAGARAALGDAAFVAAWTSGRGLSMEQAAAEAEALAAEFATGATPALPGGLMAREIEVLGLVAQGFTNAQAAERLFLSARTVDAHLRRIYDKLGTSSRAEAIRFAVQHGLNELPGSACS